MPRDFEGNLTSGQQFHPATGMPGGENVLLDLPRLTSIPRPEPSLHFARTLERYERLTGSSPYSICSLTKSIRSFEPGMQLLCQGERAGSAFIIERGWTFSSSLQPSGARQILDVQIPGDVAGLHSLFTPYALHDVTAITRVEVYEINAHLLAEAIARDPGLAPFLLWLSTGKFAVAAERLTDLGRRTALERTAHFILELATRMRLAGIGTEFAFPCPMTQSLLGDALGLTSVHVNRMMRELRVAGLAHHHCGWVRLLDKKKLADLAKFDSTYLDCANLMDKEPN